MRSQKEWEHPTLYTLRKRMANGEFRFCKELVQKSQLLYWSYEHIVAAIDSITPCL